MYVYLTDEARMVKQKILKYQPTNDWTNKGVFIKQFVTSDFNEIKRSLGGWSLILPIGLSGFLMGFLAGDIIGASIVFAACATIFAIGYVFVTRHNSALDKLKEAWAQLVANEGIVEFDYNKCIGGYEIPEVWERRLKRKGLAPDQHPLEQSPDFFRKLARLQKRRCDDQSDKNARKFIADEMVALMDREVDAKLKEVQAEARDAQRIEDMNKPVTDQIKLEQQRLEQAESDKKKADWEIGLAQDLEIPLPVLQERLQPHK